MVAMFPFPDLITLLIFWAQESASTPNGSLTITLSVATVANVLAVGHTLYQQYGRPKGVNGNGGGSYRELIAAVNFNTECVKSNTEAVREMNQGVTQKLDAIKEQADFERGRQSGLSSRRARGAGM